MAATTTAAAAALSVDIVVDTKCQRLLFAEAGKDVVDFLCSLLSLPPAPPVVGRERYSVSEDLTFTPVSTLSCASLITAWSKRKGGLQQRTVLLGHNEASEILKASRLQSNTVLSDVFLGKKAPEDGA